MKKLFFGAMAIGLMLLLFPAVNANAGIVAGHAPDRLTGTAADTLIDTVTVNVIIPARIGLYVSNDVTFDLSATAEPYLPAAFPARYWSTAPADPSVTATEAIQVFCNKAPTTGWYLEASGADFSADVLISQIHWAAHNAAASQPLANSFGTGWVQHQTGATKTTGWASYDEDWEFELQADDPAGTYTSWIAYRMYVDP